MTFSTIEGSGIGMTEHELHIMCRRWWMRDVAPVPPVTTASSSATSDVSASASDVVEGQPSFVNALELIIESCPTFNRKYERELRRLAQAKDDGVAGAEQEFEKLFDVAAQDQLG